MKSYILVLLACFWVAGASGASSVQITYDANDSAVAFGVDELEAKLKKTGYTITDESGGYTVRFKEFAPGMGPQSYRIEQEGERGMRVTAGDSVGAMYAAIEIAEKVSFGEKLEDVADYARKPYIFRRGLKFNIPFDGRTPSYDDTGDAAQENVATMWDFAFWKNYIDMMARNRYNVLTLWTTNPYPGIVKLPKYPDVNFDNVGKINIPLDPSTNRHFNDYNLFDPENHEIILEITLDEKIAYWTKVFDYAESLGIEIYFFHWNIFNWNAQGKYGITREQDNPEMIAYQRYCIEQFLKTYPQIDGIGVAAGENVNRKKKWKIGIEEWLYQTYGMGVLDVLKDDSERELRFIFRRLWADLSKSAESFAEYNVPFNTGHKYARARLFSTTTSPYLDFEYRELLEETGIPCWLNLRNDDLFMLRWGNPDYVREFLANVPRDVMRHEAGFYMGADSYVWGKAFNYTTPELQDQWEVDKHWYRFMQWGRLGYDLTLGRDYFENRLAQEHPELDASLLYDTWSASSKIVSWVDRFFFRVNDAQFAFEGMCSKNGYLGLDDSFFAHPPLRGSGFLSVQEYADSVINDQHFEGTTPHEVADTLEALAEEAVGGANSLRSKAGDLSPNSRSTLLDFEIMANLARYYALKIRAAAELAIYRADRNKTEAHAHAIDFLEQSIDAWVAYGESAKQQYAPQLLSRAGYIDWDATLESIREEVEIIKKE